MRNYFPRLLGNDEVRARVGAAIEHGTTPHAFLLGGSEGSGKFTLALEISAALNCKNRLNRNHSLPCGVCNSCKRIYDGNFTDVKILAKAKDRATIGVDQVKDFREDMYLSATESEYKIYIIKNAESMTTEAQNSLLKVLEEPPRGVVILLLANECDKILTTIKSRTQYLPMSRLDDRSLSSYLLSRSDDAAKMQIENPQKFQGIIMSADGRLGRALMLTNPSLAEKNEEERREVLSFISATKERATYSDIYSAVTSLPQKRGELSLALERILCALRDIIVSKTSAEVKPIFYVSANEAEAVSREMSLGRLLAAYDAVTEAYEYCNKNANISNVLASLAAKMRKM